MDNMLIDNGMFNGDIPLFHSKLDDTDLQGEN
jgi:hypothetical protein